MVIRIAQPVVNAGEARPLAELYGALLGMPEVHSDDDGFILIGHEQPPGIAFDPVGDYVPPRWPDPAYPQQVHFDIAVSDYAVAEQLVLAKGATRLTALDGPWQVFADPAGHPFCLYASDFAPSDRGRIDTIWFDCADPAALAAFYRALLRMDPEPQPGPDDWVIGRDGEYPRLGFHRIDDYRPPRWPDPAYPQHIHLDIFVDDVAVAEQLGATRLPQGGSWPTYADPAGHPFCLGVSDDDD